MKLFNKVLVANRGEIAVRVMRSLKELGIKSVAVYSEADRTSMHVRQADESLCIGPAQSKKSYLNIPAIISAAKIAGADAIHPGYGFLAENAEFSRACKENGIVFIGPDAKSIELLGNKSTARKIARENSVPIIPGTKGCITKNFESEAQAIGYPIIIKAAAGGGGKGMRIVNDPSKLLHEVEMAMSEAKAAFGNDAIFFEKYIENPRHVEMQFARDVRGNTVAFPERDCSIQRRHQKLLEESPSPAVNAEIRQKLAKATVRLVNASNYVGVGTVEFLMDKNGNFYFMEVNTRLQVEHPVTEVITGVDLVREQILIAAGEKLTLRQTRLMNFSGHAIEHRINAEDSQKKFAPSPGKIEEWILPGGSGIRVDTHIYQGYTLPMYYDSLIAKLIVWAPNRNLAIRKSKRALSEFYVRGIPTTIRIHKMIVDNPDFCSGDTDTHFIERLFTKVGVR